MTVEKLVSHKMIRFARKNNWLVSGEYIYGEEQNFLFTGMDSKKQKSFITPVPGITQDQIDDLLALLEKNKSIMKLDEYEIADDFLCIRIHNSFSLKPDHIDFSLALLTSSMQQVSIVATDRCQVCKELGAGSTGFVYDLYCSMHDKCAEIQKQEEDDLDSADIKESSDSSTTTEPAGNPAEAPPLPEDSLPSVSTRVRVLYTLFGALLGAIPWLILPFVIDLINDYGFRLNAPGMLVNFIQSLLTCLCAYLISSFAITGYKMSKAPIDTLGRKVIGITAIAVVIVIQFAYLAVLIIKEPQVHLTFSNYFTNLVKFHFYITMLLGAFIGVVFVLISVLPFFDKKGSDKPPETIHDELSDDPGQSASDQDEP
jgi:hypothetical protein